MALLTWEHFFLGLKPAPSAMGNIVSSKDEGWDGGGGRWIIPGNNEGKLHTLNHAGYAGGCAATRPSKGKFGIIIGGTRI